MPWSESLPQFSFAGTVLTVLLLLFAAVGEPFLGRRAFAWLSRRRDGDARALTLMHAATVGIHVLWGLAVLGVLVLSPDLAAADLGLRAPHAWGPIAGGAVGGLSALAALWVLANGLPKGPPPLGAGRGGGRGGRRGRGPGQPAEQAGPGTRGRRSSGHRGRRASAAPVSLPEPERHRGLLVPRNTAERVLAAGVAVTGGVFGELLYRGLFIVLVASMGVPLWIAAVLSVALFSVAHLYQGWWGLVSAGASGTLFTVLYLGTGSVWVPVLVHVALDLRSLVFPPAAVREAWEQDCDEHGYEEQGYEEYAEAGHDDGYGEEYAEAGHDDGYTRSGYARTGYPGGDLLGGGHGEPPSSGGGRRPHPGQGYGEGGYGDGADTAGPGFGPRI
ncbi:MULTISPECIES: CPBP family intramembrane glutamic endopeptidase [unclassified Nocardiopsis]|uniref:CPBP family intramembrane glutamic endopeptidase n=1 Tax=unclassified Nocardiopsis TaxID=2649073 RepID=UPI0009F8F30D|nr:CPBP family intramembrane glutamic endopeptidase [Nocardiopsis sp. TSRI0078]